MTPKNPIIRAHRRELREERENRVKIMLDIREYKPTDIITLREYCPVPRPADLQEILLEAVRKEDAINHIFSPVVIPDDTRIVSIKMTTTSTRAFFKQIFSI